MITKVLILFGIMFLFLLLRFPVFLALGLAATGVALLFPGTVPVAVIGQGLLSGLNNYNFAAIMFYFLLGEIMNGGGMSNRLIKFGTAIIGHIRGSLSHLNILASMIFAGVSGSAVADTAAIGSLLIPAMKKDGYSAGYAAAVTASSSTIGPIIPPSGGLVLMGIYLSVSINRLFLGGMVPGILMGIALLIVSFITSWRRNYPKTAWRGWRYAFHVFRESLFAFLLPVIVVFCLVAGIGTVVEIGALAVGCAVIISAFIYHELNLKQFIQALCRAAENAAKVLCILACAGVFTWIISSMGMAAALAKFITSFTTNPTVVLIICMLILLFFGCILEVNVIQMVIIPTMVPIIRAVGIDPIQFGVLAMLVTMMGLITPPVGSLIYITAGIAEESPLKVIKELTPFTLALVALVTLLIFFPGLVTAFPNWVMS